MTFPDPGRLVELACQSLLREEAMAIAALESLPVELFPPLFVAAFAGRHSKTLKAMVQAWPFPCLPMGALMKERQPYHEIIQAALDGLDVLLSQEARPRRWKLQMLDLQKNSHQDFWTRWSGTKSSMCSLLEPEMVQPMKKRQKVDGSGVWSKPPSASMEVFIDLYLKEGTPDKSIRYLIKKVRQKRGLLHLCCEKLQISSVSVQNIRILKMVQLNSVLDLEVNCTWKLFALEKFIPYLGQMGNLHRLTLSHIYMSFHITPEQEEQCASQFSSQFLSLLHLQELYLDSISFLQGHLDQLLRCLKTPLETLSITNCLLLEIDLMNLSQSLNVSQLKDLSLTGVNLTGVSYESLQVLLERASATLQDLELDDCGIMDLEFTAILRILSHCSQLTTFSFCGNPVSVAVLEDLLRHTTGLRKLSQVLYPAPVESYQDIRGNLDLGILAQMHIRLRQVLQELGRPGVIWFGANHCANCGNRLFYDPDPILCHCYMSV
ncbi:melanoma antigen preferentially expressed in tumors-like [Hipposideros larvatus]